MGTVPENPSASERKEAYLNDQIDGWKAKAEAAEEQANALRAALKRIAFNRHDASPKDIATAALAAASPQDGTP